MQVSTLTSPVVKKGSKQIAMSVHCLFCTQINSTLFSLESLSLCNSFIHAYMPTSMSSCATNEKELRGEKNVTKHFIVTYENLREVTPVSLYEQSLA